MSKKTAASMAAERVKERIAKVVERELPTLITPLINAAKAGDVMAFRELMDRGFGKAAQAVELEVEERKMITDDSPKTSIPSPYLVGGAIENDE